MATLFIGYDLNKQKNYPDLIAEIKRLGAWWHHLDSSWLVVTTATAEEARDLLITHLDGDDELLVIDVTGRARAWYGITESGSKWLRETYE